jgi:2-amino-4-hydroxy-6-hydroxymethyldihydropteridine diphosphokinase
VYETAPWGVTDQPDYLNAILIVADPTADARDWLVRSQAAEDAAGRERNVRWDARTLDVDVISVDDEHSDDATLTLPHPRAAQRAFVLVPWLAVDAKAALPGVGSVASLLEALPSDEVAGVRPRPDLVLE